MGYRRSFSRFLQIFHPTKEKIHRIHDGIQNRIPWTGCQALFAGWRQSARMVTPQSGSAAWLARGLRTCERIRACHAPKHQPRVIPSEARNLALLIGVLCPQPRARFLASLGMTRDRLSLSPRDRPRGSYIVNHQSTIVNVRGPDRRGPGPFAGIVAGLVA